MSIICYRIVDLTFLKQSIRDLEHYSAAEWAADCAEHVLHIFEQENPNDMRPREAIAVARAWSEGTSSVGEARRCAFASHAAARSAVSKDAEFAARSAGHAAATAHVKSHAVHAAEYALKSVDDDQREYHWQTSALRCYTT